MAKTRKEDSKPTIGKRDGLLYPLIYNFLQIEKWWPTERLLLYKYRDSRLVTDIYIASGWFIEAFLLFTLVRFNHISAAVRILAISILIYRLIEIVLKLIATLILGRFRLPAEHHHQNRTVMLVLSNLVEIIVIYSAFYFCLDTYVLNTCELIGVNGFIDALYFSIATGITLSFGQQFPKETWSKFVAISEPVIILVLVIGMISFARGSSTDTRIKGK